MREEKISYMEDLFLDISLLNIRNYPIHWHDATEIVFVLKGRIDISIGRESYRVEAGQLEIVNHNEVHSIKSDRDNLVLLLNIDPDFFTRYYEEGREVFFYADSSKKNVQETERYLVLREYIAILYYEYISKFDDYKDILDEKLVAMLYYLLNNFHYLFYEEESLREDEFELERYHRLVNYISNNYMNKISLQELADQEFLNSQYLSSKLKSTFGYGFNDFLNLTRVEESIKLLLNTEKTISEISDDMGFSHVRYYNKHFKIHYGLSPMEYRQRYKLREEDLEREKDIEELDIKEALDYLKGYLEDYERYEHDDRIHKFDIDIRREAVASLQYPDTIYLNKVEDLFKFDEKKYLDWFESLGFNYCIINSLEGVFQNGKVNIEYFNRFLDRMSTLKLRPIFLVEDKITGDDIRKELANYGREDLVEILLREEYSYKDSLTELDSSLNDSIYIVSHIFKKALEGNTDPVRFMDSFRFGDSDTFSAQTGLVTHNGLKKPSYFAHRFLNNLGSETLYDMEGILVTRKDQGFQILLYSPLDRGGKFFRGQKNYSINIINMLEEYRMVEYDLNKDSGSVYDKWSYLGSPKYLGEDYLRLLDESSNLEIKFHYRKKQTVNNILTKIVDGGAKLYVFEKVQ